MTLGARLQGAKEAGDDGKVVGRRTTAGLGKDVRYKITKKHGKIILPYHNLVMSLVVIM